MVPSAEGQRAPYEAASQEEAERLVAESVRQGEKQLEGFNNHHKPEGRSVVWLTPPHIIEALGPFDLDPCAAPEPRPWPTAARHYTLPTDGLAEPWEGRVWLNPPYGTETWTWLNRLADHGNGIGLVFARTEVKGFHEAVWGRADAVLFLRGRLSFHLPDGSLGKANSGAPSCLVAYGENNVQALLDSGLPGALSVWEVME